MSEKPGYLGCRGHFGIWSCRGEERSRACFTGSGGEGNAAMEAKTPCASMGELRWGGRVGTEGAKQQCLWENSRYGHTKGTSRISASAVMPAIPYICIWLLLSPLAPVFSHSNWAHTGKATQVPPAPASRFPAERCRVLNTMP